MLKRAQEGAKPSGDSGPSKKPRTENGENDEEPTGDEETTE